MKLYIANGRYVGTQAEAKAIDKNFDLVEVPTDKEGLIGYLNAHCFSASVLDEDDEYTPVVTRSDPPVERTPAAIMTLEELFAEAPLTMQVDLVVSAMDRVNAALRSPLFAPVNPVMPEVAAMVDEDELFA